LADRATANLPSRNFDQTAAFYLALGFSVGFKDDGWMILQRGALELEFFPMPLLNPKQSWFSACFRVDDLDGLYAEFQKAGLANVNLSAPKLEPFGLRIFTLIDLDGSLIRCIENTSSP
jgi:hypothetical protein